MQKEIEVDWTHEKLVEDLALARGTCLWNVPLGSVQLSCAQIADVVEVKKSFTQFCLSIFEVKVNRADFLKDLRSGKWRGYLDHCHRFYFAAPSGIIAKDEVPFEAGLVVRGPSSWQFKKSAPRRRVEIPSETLLSLVFLKNRKTSRERAIAEIAAIYGGYHRTLATYGMSRSERVARKFGRELAEAWAARQAWKSKQQELQLLIDRIEQEIGEVLGVEARWPSWELAKLVRAIKQKAKDLGIDVSGDGGSTA